MGETNKSIGGKTLIKRGLSKAKKWPLNLITNFIFCLIYYSNIL